MKKQFNAANGITFLVRVVPKGGYYGAECCLTNKGKEPLVEFYDTRKAFDYDFVGSKEAAIRAGAPALGQFVSRYSMSTIMAHPRASGLDYPRASGLDLMVYEPSWKIDGGTMESIQDWLECLEVEEDSQPAFDALAQMRTNFDFLLKHIDAIHAALCTHQKHAGFRTWQQRAEEATKEAQRLAAIKKEEDRK